MEEPELVLHDLLDSDAWIRALAPQLVTDPNDAEDIVQEAWVAALQNPPERSSSIRSWLARVVRRIAGARRRSDEQRKRREQVVARPERLQSVADLRERARTR